MLRYCPYCGYQVSDKALRCPHCGAELGVNKRPDNYYTRGYQKHNEENLMAEGEYTSLIRPRTWQTESIILGIAAFCCCTIWTIPFAVVAFMKSQEADNLWLSGNRLSSIEAAQKAKTNIVVGFWVAVIPVAIAIVFGILSLIFGIGLVNLL